MARRVSTARWMGSESMEGEGVKPIRIRRGNKWPQRMSEIEMVSTMVYCSEISMVCYTGRNGRIRLFGVCT